MVTSPTPLAFSRLRLICLSAIRVTSRRDRGADTATRKMGAASGSNFCTTGCLAVCGKSLTIRLTFRRDGADLVHLADGVDRVFDLLADFGFDFFRRCARIGDHHHYRGDVD